MPDVVAMRWEEAIVELQQHHFRIAGLEVVQGPRGNPEHSGRWRVIRQVVTEPGFVSLTLARESGYGGRPVIEE